MTGKLYLLDGMALVYRAHFALIRNPIFTSKKLNTSAIFGFANTLLDILKNQKPTHLAVAFDTRAPTLRHEAFPTYKAQREEMPEDLSVAIPHIKRMIEAFRIPILELDGFEADDIIGTLAKQAEEAGLETYMVTPDKDFGQLVTEKTLIYRPGRQGSDAEVWGVQEVLEKWEIQRVDQVIDMLGLMGDVSDNIPGVSGVGQKTAAKLINEYGSIEALLESSDQLKGKLKERIESGKEAALLSKQLATIVCDAPIGVKVEDLKIKSADEEQLKNLFVEFEFNSLGRRLFGEDFKAGRGFVAPSPDNKGFGEMVTAEMFPSQMKTISDIKHAYTLITGAEARKDLAAKLKKQKSFCFDIETDSLDPKVASILGIAFSIEPHKGFYAAVLDQEEEVGLLEDFREVLENEAIEKVGHNLKYDITVLAWKGITVRGKMFDTMLAYSLIEPDERHTMDFMAERFLGYTPISITSLIGERGKDQKNLKEIEVKRVAEYAAEDADVTLQLRAAVEPLLKKKKQEAVFYQVECPLIPVLVRMERHGVAIDARALEEFSDELNGEIENAKAGVFKLAGKEFNLNSPKQLGEVLFDDLRIVDKPKKTKKTGQYKTNEQVLETLAHSHEIVRSILDYRKASKLKSTYVDTLPEWVFDKTGRVHTTYNQAVTATGRLQSQNPNLQNIPIRTEKGKEIRRAFVPQGEGFTLLAADYSQIELRIMAELSKDEGMLEAFRQNQDIHTSTAAKVYGVQMDEVTDEMRRSAKMVNFGIIYGISAFGLSQRLGIPRTEAAEIIDQYFEKYSGVRRYMTETLNFARANGYVETVTGRRRYLRDINSRNGTIRQAVERNAINAPIQGTAADMIKLAMAEIDRRLQEGEHRTRMLLQVHDELVFELYEKERPVVEPMIVQAMEQAIPMKVPIVVETGVGSNWLQAH